MSAQDLPGVVKTQMKPTNIAWLKIARLCISPQPFSGAYRCGHGCNHHSQNLQCWIATFCSSHPRLFHAIVLQHILERSGQFHDMNEHLRPSLNEWYRNAGLLLLRTVCCFVTYFQAVLYNVMKHPKLCFWVAFYCLDWMLRNPCRQSCWWSTTIFVSLIMQSLGSLEQVALEIDGGGGHGGFSPNSTGFSSGGFGSGSNFGSGPITTLTWSTLQAMLLSVWKAGISAWSIDCVPVHATIIGWQLSFI